MIRIEVVSTTVDEKHGTSRKSGKPYAIREQNAYAHVLDESGKPAKYPVQCRIGLEENAPPYTPGMYQLDPRSIFVGEFGRLSIGRLRLVPLAQPANRAA